MKNWSMRLKLLVLNWTVSKILVKADVILHYKQMKIRLYNAMYYVLYKGTKVNFLNAQLSDSCM